MLTSLYSGDKRIHHIKNIICKAISTAADQTIWLASLSKDNGSPLFDEDAKITLYEKAISFYKTLYEAGDYFFDAESLAEAEKHIADILASRKDAENTLYHLGECIKYVVMFDTYDETTDTYTSMIPFGRHPVGINWNNEWNKSHEMLMRLSNDINYDFVRDKEEFKRLTKLLTQIDNMK